MEKLLALLVFVASAVSASCLWSMTYTFYYGKLPFDMKPYVEIAGYGKNEKEVKADIKKEKGEAAQKAENKENGVAEGDDTGVDTQIVEKIDFTPKSLRDAKLNGGKAMVSLLKEKYIVEFYEDLVKEKNKLVKEREILADKQRNIEKTEESAKALQQKVEELQKEIKDTLVFIGDEEKKNMMQLVNLISSLEVTEAKKMLFKYDDDMMARMLRFMVPKKSSAIVSFVLKSKKEEEVDRIKVISDKMRQLTEEKK